RAARVKDVNQSETGTGHVVLSVGILLGVRHIDLHSATISIGDGLDPEWRVAGRQSRIDKRPGGQGLTDPRSVKDIDLVVVKVSGVEQGPVAILRDRQAFVDGTS